jgi:hypothetical protein
MRLCERVNMRMWACGSNRMTEIEVIHKSIGSLLSIHAMTFLKVLHGSSNQFISSMIAVASLRTGSTGLHALHITH